VPRHFLAGTWTLSWSVIFIGRVWLRLVRDGWLTRLEPVHRDWQLQPAAAESGMYEGSGRTVKSKSD
jgi:hypothetical protein